MADWTFSEVDVVKWRNAVRISISKLGYPCAETLEINTKNFDYGHQMGMMVSMNILTQNIENYQWPRNWKQSLKERFLPGFILKRWPVEYTKIEVKAIYPKAKLPDPVFKVKEIYGLGEEYN